MPASSTNHLRLTTALLLLPLVAVARSQTESAASKPTQPLVVEATFPLSRVTGKVGSIAAHPDGARLYVGGIDTPSVTSINIVERLYLGESPTTYAPGSLCVAGPSGCVFVSYPKGFWSGFVESSNSSDLPPDKPGFCRVFDADKFDGRSREPRPDMYKVLAEVHLRDVDGVQEDPVTKQVWAGYRDGLALLEASRTEPVTRIALDEHPASFRFEVGGKRRAFVNLPKSGLIAVVDASNGQVVDRWKLLDAKENGPMALDETGKRLFVVCRKPAKILVFDTDKGKVIAWTDCAADAGDIHVDQARRRLYVTGDGAITVLSFDKDRFKSLAKIPVAPGARTSAWIPSSSRLCVGVPIKGKDSEVWVYRAMP